VIKAVVLLSGGLDSAVALSLALAEGRECFPLAFDYSQRHAKEVTYARKIAHLHSRALKACHQARVVELIGLDFSTSALTSALPVPQGPGEPDSSKIPVTYVPARNSIFLSIGTAFAESLGADEVWAGYNAVDYSGYPDCRPEYVTAMEGALALGTKRGVEGRPIALRAPIVRDSKVEIVRKGLRLQTPFEYTWSCYVGQEKPCGLCDSCKIRAAAFAALGCEDPAR
jgi:7-cyano-7-deazaguanine synthase